MIHFLKGDIFDAGTDAIVNPVNCVGVMGAGLAGKFKVRYPYNFIRYKEACKRKNSRSAPSIRYWFLGLPHAP
jgi:O-acetyl-ADP-ribose deacetylase (regulator of RNase III)